MNWRRLSCWSWRQVQQQRTDGAGRTFGRRWLAKRVVGTVWMVILLRVMETTLMRSSYRGRTHFDAKMGETHRYAVRY